MTDLLAASLARPLDIGGHTLRNRLAATAHSTGLGREGSPVDADAVYWGRLADGGLGLAIVGGTAVAEESTALGRYRTEAYRPASIPGMRGIATAVKASGALAICQLVHVGREAAASTPFPLVGPSEIASPREAAAPRALSTAEVRSMVGSFAISAANALEAGYDGIEIHAAHGYLVAQFLAEAANERTDAYGGSPEARTRFLVEILDAIRALAPDAVLGVRLSDEGAFGGIGAAEVAAVLRRLAAVAPVDYVNVTVGVRHQYVPDMGVEHPRILGELPAIRAAAGCPVLASQSFRTPEDVAAALDAGADLVGFVRPLLADPDLPRKLLDGRAAAIRPCISCNEDCRSFQPRILCAVNPDLAPPGERRRAATPLLLQDGDGAGREVAVVGAGPAGLECALTLGRAGFRVTVHEAADEIGGAVTLAGAAPGRSGWRRLVDFYGAGLEEAGVDVVLGTSADAERLAAADDVVLALGSREVPPALSGIERARTTSDVLRAGVDAFAGLEHVLVADDGFGWWPGVSTVELALAAGARVTVLAPSGAFAAGIPVDSRVQLLARIRGARLDARAFLELAAVDDGAVVARHRISGETETVAADAVVVVGRRTPVPLDMPLPAGVRVQAIGDGITPRRLAQAIAEGRAAAEVIAEARIPLAT